MFAQLLDVLSGFLKYVQVEGCREDTERSHAANQEHLRIVEAIKERHPERARMEMGYHLNRSCEALTEKLK